jgi:hypothetical protein
MHSDIPFGVNEECTIQTAAIAIGGTDRAVAQDGDGMRLHDVPHLQANAAPWRQCRSMRCDRRHKTTADANEMCSWH